MISNYLNYHEEFHRNDLILPLYDPKKGKTDFLDDKHLVWTHGYIGFLAGMESQLGDDMRYIMEAMPYDAYLKRLNKQMNYDKYRNAPGSDEFRF